MVDITFIRSIIYLALICSLAVQTCASSETTIEKKGVNRELSSLHGGSLEITLTVPIIKANCTKCTNSKRMKFSLAKTTDLRNYFEFLLKI